MSGFEFFRRGWCRFGEDARLARWGLGAVDVARKAVGSPEYSHWHRCGGTWFVGVEALDNDDNGMVIENIPLAGQVVDFVKRELVGQPFVWDRAQISVCYSGYPQQMDSENDAAFQYRLRRDAAHVDGIRRVGEDGRRYLREYHGFLLGIPLVPADKQASPFVVWEGSHELVRTTLSRHFAGKAPELWGDMDITDVYQEMRRHIFSVCPRKEIWAQPGESYLVHRLALHGIAPWGEGATASHDGRMICYFRPQIGGPAAWLMDP